MHAIGYVRAGAGENLVDLELEKPRPRPRDLLISVKAVSVNPVDVKLRAHATPAEGQARVLGFDAAGVVEAVGSEVTLFRPGERVWYAGAIDRPGSNADYQVVDERIVGRMPDSLDFAAAAALPLTSITAWELLFDRMKVGRGDGAGESLLVVGGAGGVGSILVQLARRLTQLHVIATASRPESESWCRELGAHEVIDHRQPMDEQLAGRAVRYVAALTGTEQHVPTFAKLLAPFGCIAVIDDPPALDIVPFKRKSATVAWELMFTRSLFQTRDMIEQHRLLNEVARLVDEGTVRTTMRERLEGLSAANLRTAHARVESGRSIGKVVIG